VFFFCPNEYVINKVHIVTFWSTKRSLVGRCDLELDPGARWGSERPKNKSAQNLLKIDVCVGLDITNPMQLEWDQMGAVCSRYRDLFIFPNRQKK
jgi:hypothetical protein